MVPTGMLATYETMEALFERGWSDGLPVMPPVRSVVDDMVARSGRDPHEVLGIMPPRYIEVTVRDVATNAVMAGCLPEYLPVVLAATQLLLAADFNPLGVSTTTKGVAPLMILNGPVRERLGINGRGNLFGPGPRSNATIGRALRLLMLNAGGATPRVLDKTTIGSPGKYGQVIGEDEEGSGWTPLHVDHGYAADESVLTLVAVEGVAQILTQGPTKPETILDTFIESLNVTSHYTSGGPTECVLIIAPEHRAIIQRAGWDKRRAQEYVHENCWRRAGDLWRAERDARGFKPGDPEDSRVNLFAGPEDLIVVAGGGPGVISGYCWGFADHQLLGHSAHMRIQLGD